MHNLQFHGIYRDTCTDICTKCFNLWITKELSRESDAVVMMGMGLHHGLYLVSLCQILWLYMKRYRHHLRGPSSFFIAWMGKDKENLRDPLLGGSYVWIHPFPGDRVWHTVAQAPVLTGVDCCGVWIVQIEGFHWIKSCFLPSILMQDCVCLCLSLFL